MFSDLLTNPSFQGWHYDAVTSDTLSSERTARASAGFDNENLE
jgi:hypothetical protein